MVDKFISRKAGYTGLAKASLSHGRQATQSWFNMALSIWCGALGSDLLKP